MNLTIQDTREGLPSFGELRSQLNVEPEMRYRAWQMLCRWLEQTGTDGFERYEEYLEGHLEPWGDDERRVPGRWLEALAQGNESDWMRICRTMSLSGRGNYREPEGVRRIKRSQLWRGITRLEVWREPLGRELFFGLIRAPEGTPYRAPLEQFLGVKLRLGSGFLSEMFAAASFAQVRDLTLHTTSIMMSDLDDFCGGQLCAQIEQLDLSDNSLGTEGFDIVTQSPFMRPRTLVWTDNATDLSQAHPWPEFFDRLESLTWGHWGPSETIEVLFAMLGSSPLRHLVLQGEGINNETLRKLVDSEVSGMLEHLVISGARVKCSALKDLLESARFPNLREIDARHCHFSAKERDWLSSRAQSMGLLLHL